MPVLFGGFSLLLLALWIFCIFDVITTDPLDTRHLPKMMWLIIVLILPDIGSIIWLLVGRPRNWAVPAAAPRPVAKASNPDDDDDFQRQLRERVEEQRRKAREQEEKDEI